MFSKYCSLKVQSERLLLFFDSSSLKATKMMTSKLPKRVLFTKVEAYQDLIKEASISNKPCFQKDYLRAENQLLSTPAWFKGSRDRGLKGDLAA